MIPYLITSKFYHCMSIKNVLSVLVLSLCLITTGCNSKRKELCTDKPAMELAEAKFGKHHRVFELLKTLEKNGYVSQEYSDETRSQFVAVQYLFESTFASMAKYKQALKVVGVLYAPAPSTPLRTDGNNISLLLNKDQINKPEIIDTIVARHESLHEFLRSNATIYSIHENVNSSIPGINIYDSVLRMNPNTLKDIAVNKVDPKFIGASYLLECHNGQKILFSILSSQVSEINPRGQWELFYGNIDENENLYNHFVKLQSVYKEHSVDFNLN